MKLRLGLAAVLLTACSGPLATFPTASASAAGTEALPTESTTATSADPSLLPLPSAFPVPAGAEGVHPDSGWGIAAWRVDQEPPVVHDFYASALPRAGYEVTLDAPGGEMAIFRFASPEGVPYQLDLVGRGPVRIQLGAPHD